MSTLLNKGWNALAWRFRDLVGDARLDRAICNGAVAWRKLLNAKVFVAVAGSVGKTTTKDLLVGILSARYSVAANVLSRNAAPEIAKIVLRVRPWTRYCVAELGETGPNTLDSMLTLLRPAIAIVTNVGDDHISAFGSRDAIANELCKAALAVPKDGVVVLNEDDPRVARMADGLKCRILKFGTSESADIRASDVICVWPEPLEFSVEYQAQSIRVKTQLYGRQLLTSALAAIGGGLAAGLSLAECADGISTVPPAEGRMQIARCKRNITFIRDDFKAPRWTIDILLEQIRDARARRKILVLGTISDCAHKVQEYPLIARQALAVVDIVIVTGRFASSVLKVRDSDTENRLHAYTNIRDASALVHSICRDDDLIVLKGNNKKDHLGRIPLSFNQLVNCWIDDCKRDMFCSECSHLTSQHGVPDLTASANRLPGKHLPIVGQGEQVVIGLGNPGAEYSVTPHNVGYETLDCLCLSLNLEWQDYPEAWIAHGTTKHQGIWLIKVKSAMNLTGQAVQVLSEIMGFTPEQCVLVFDDVDLPLGKVRTKMNGSSGGHRGVASVLDAFQTDKIRRVKIGVTAGEKKPATTKNVLRQFSAEDQEKIKPALQLASARIVEMFSS